MPMIECRRVVFFSEADEASFFRFAESIPAVRRIKGRGDAILLHVAARVSRQSQRDLSALLRRYQVDERQLGNIAGGRRAAQPRRTASRTAPAKHLQSDGRVGRSASSRVRR